jgi:cell division transport system permease protein
MTAASITVLFSCLLLVGIAFMLLANIEMFINNIEQENVIMVYADTDINAYDYIRMGVELKSIDYVGDVISVEKGPAYEEILEGLDENLREYLESVEENPLPDAYRVVVSDMSKFDYVVEKINGVENVLRIHENSALAKNLAALRNAVQYISFGIIILLLIVSLFIISNTIKVTMFSRRLEISIMKSVGATNRFIRWPFIVEGVLIGIISGVLSTLAIWGVYVLGIRYLTAAVGIAGKGVDIKEYLPLLLGAFLILGIFTGIFGSASSIRKYLKERKFVELEDL